MRKEVELSQNPDVSREAGQLTRSHAQSWPPVHTSDSLFALTVPVSRPLSLDLTTSVPPAPPCAPSCN